MTLAKTSNRIIAGTQTLFGRATTATKVAAATATVAAATAAVMIAWGGGAMAATQSPGATRTGTAVNCAASPHVCGYPDATNSGVPAGTTLKSVPGQVSSGPGWKYDPRGWVEVTGKGANLSDLYIPYNVDIEASNVTINNVHLVTDGPFGISLRHTTGVTIENSTISGLNSTTGRVDAAISDVYEDSTGMVFKDNNISDFRIGIQAPTGLIAGNYIHNPGYIAGDHTNGITATGSTEPMTIQDNTVFNDLGQTDAITLDASSSGQPVANKNVVGNFLAGGSYSIYGGDGNNDSTSNIVFEGNRFAQLYYPKAGQYGPVAYFDSTGTGNVWSGNVWDTTGKVIPS